MSHFHWPPPPKFGKRFFSFPPCSLIWEWVYVIPFPFPLTPGPGWGSCEGRTTSWTPRGWWCSHRTCPWSAIPGLWHSLVSCEPLILTGPTSLREDWVWKYHIINLRYTITIKHKSTIKIISSSSSAALTGDIGEDTALLRVSGPSNRAGGELAAAWWWLLMIYITAVRRHCTDW